MTRSAAILLTQVKSRFPLSPERFWVQPDALRWTLRFETTLPQFWDRS